jgi:allantoinase
LETELWVKNGLVLTEEGFRHVIIKMKDERVVSIVEDDMEPIKEEDGAIIDASGFLVVPGFIDSHVHFNDPGRTAWEGIETGSKAAVIGGTTTIFDMPLNCSPSVTNGKTLQDKKEYLAEKSYVDYALWGGLTDDSFNDVQELNEMSNNGIIAWKAFMCDSGIEDFKRVADDQLIQAMKIAKNHQKVLALHAEWQEEIERYTTFFRNQEVINERISYLASRPESAEEKAVTYALELAAKYGTAIHFVHISSAKVVELIQQAKQSGVDVTVETCPHYLLFDESDFIKTGAILKCSPPLRSRDEVEGLWECIKKGWIDTIGSDHSPCPYTMKATTSIWEAWGGIQGVQFTWLALLDEALKRNIPLSKIVPLGTSNVAERFGIINRKGRIQVGNDADLVFISLDEITTVEKESIAFRNKYSPYVNMTFQLKVKKTILRGKVIYDDQFGIAGNRHGICIE